MALRDWSGRRIAAVWAIAVVVEVLVILIGARHPITIDYVPPGTRSTARIVDSGPPMPGLLDSGVLPDSLRDSLLAWGRVITDSLVRQFAKAEGAAARKAMLLAALILLPLPLTALGITTRWAWLRRASNAGSADEAAA